MATIKYKPTTPARQTHDAYPSFAEITKFSPEKKLTGHSQEDTPDATATASITVRHIGGGNKNEVQYHRLQAQWRLDSPLPSSASSTILTEPRTSLSLQYENGEKKLHSSLLRV